MNADSHKTFGPWLVALGASLWATDAIFRSQIVGAFTATEIVAISHLVCAPICLMIAWPYRKLISKLSRKDWVTLLFLAAGPSSLAMVMFTQSFATAGNYNVPILVQKLQPAFAIALAAIFLGERPKRMFWVLAPTAMLGAFLISFGWTGCPNCLNGPDPWPVALAFGAAFIWGAGTVVGRHLVLHHPWQMITSLRYLVALPILWAFVVGQGGMTFSKPLMDSMFVFAVMAIGPGLIALFIYYSGLTFTSASVATIAELAYPAAAIGVNWLLLDQELTQAQITGTIVLLGSITALSLTSRHAKPPLAS
jgi:drug/metabolite transporter (DMT)-like permease